MKDRKLPKYLFLLYLCGTAWANPFWFCWQVIIQRSAGIFPAVFVIHSRQVPCTWEQILNRALWDIVGCMEEKKKSDQCKQAIIPNTSLVVCVNNSVSVLAKPAYFTEARLWQVKDFPLKYSSDVWIWKQSQGTLSYIYLGCESSIFVFDLNQSIKIC